MRRALLALLTAVAALLAAGCGDKEEIVTLGETEGIYIDVGELKYQVQISRQLNPDDVVDKGYFTGLPAGETGPTAEETWFGVFLRVENTRGGLLPTATEFEIIDTQEKVYKPLELDSELNAFAYAPAELAATERVPAHGSLAFYGPTQGALLLFKLTIDSLANRPLELRIVSPTDPENVGVVDLDV